MAIEFFTVLSIEPAVAHLVLSISRHLAANDRVLWLVSGGSTVKIAVETANRLNSEGLDNIRNLSVSLVDERYGPAGHSDSNWQQLTDAGFTIKGANMLIVLTNVGLEQTAKNYAELIKSALMKHDYILGLVGIGADGHTLGIKPRSPATSSNDLVCAYSWDDYIRMTLTPKIIPQFDEIVAYAVGQEKYKVLDELDKSISPKQQPAQYLKLARQFTVYNDYKGTKI
ncbi:hypothetical protein A3J32_03250 [Candidatus Saccharibacteria bacterium RIFCSPLOWO2_02_FULL_46_7]|nr:MAG: hypothetical protein A3J32_03250 [Candidatus Saccharibacteria bacterium RIFCSPLOWO2_02_FULL_46_7]